MKIKETVPVISSLLVVIEGLKYKDTLCTIEVNCLCTDAEKPTFSITKASCDEPYFIAGKSFWKEKFGTRQVNRIEKLCVEDYLKS